MPAPEARAPAKGSYRGTLLWDLSGTLFPYDPTTGRSGVLPGCDEFLPELGRDFRLVVTTGEGTASARSLLADNELLPLFERIFGDLPAGGGKPYGEILRQLGADPRRSLAVGDRLAADLPVDTADLVTLLINQDGQVLNAGRVAFMIDLMRRRADTFPEAFDALTDDAEPAADLLGPTRGGRVTEAWRREDGFPYRLLHFEHSRLDAPRRVIII